VAWILATKINVRRRNPAHETDMDGSMSTDVGNNRGADGVARCRFD
jgi:hypothetical protein